MLDPAGQPGCEASLEGTTFRIAADPPGRSGITGTNRATGVPARLITISSPASTRAISRESWVFASNDQNLWMALGLVT